MKSREYYTDKIVTMTFIIIYRADIPVIIMGETGCGKTRLIRYMCDLAKQGQNVRNMLIMKVRKR